MNAGKLDISFTPDELAGVESGDDKEEKHGAALNRHQHEEGDRIDVSLPHAAGEVAVSENENEHGADDAPEGKLVQDIRDAQASEGQELYQVVAALKVWWTTGSLLPPANAWAWLQRNRASRSRRLAAHAIWQ